MFYNDRYHTIIISSVTIDQEITHIISETYFYCVLIMYVGLITRVIPRACFNVIMFIHIDASDVIDTCLMQIHILKIPYLLLPTHTFH